jgi:HEAT repeat protein
LHADISATKATFDPPRKSQQLVTANSTNIDEESNRDKQSHEKAQMIAGLANVGPQADIKLIKQALMDESPEVRAQAVFALAKTAGDTALSEMRLALHDENPEVRMMVVDNVDNNLNLLTEATEDEDPQVRQMAISKLALLNKSGGY